MSAYTSGTAANHVDLLDRLVTFLSTGLGSGENWEVLRYTGVAEIAASSQASSWEAFNAIKGPYGDHANGWATAVGQQANCWISLRLCAPLDLARLRLKGSATADQSPNTFRLQYSDNGTDWSDRKSWTAIAWTASEIKELAIDGASPGAKSWWRILVSANNGNTTQTAITGIALPEWLLTADFDHGRRPAAWLKAPGMTGLDPVYVNFQIYDRPTSDYYNLALTGTTGFVGAADFDNQPGAHAALAIPLWNQDIPYWFSASGQRVAIACRVGTVYLAAYAGKLLTFGTPGQYPYPLVLGAPLPTASATRYSDAALNLPYKGNRSTLRLRKSDATWIQPYAWPYAQEHTIRDTGGGYPLLPITLYDGANTYGVLDGVFHVTGWANSAENRVEVGAEDYIVIPAVSATGLNDYFAQRTA
jgi:F5/8 type C domain